MSLWSRISGAPFALAALTLRRIRDGPSGVFEK
jgi:hypothetical protein